MALRKLLRIQYVSDLHLEFYEKAVFPLLVKPCAKYLALAGDIGVPNTRIWDSFFSYVNDHWEKVFYVTGNHEYYSSKNKMNMEVIHEQIRTSLEKYSRVTLLDSQNPTCFLPKENVAIVGNTLWTEIPEDDAPLIQRSMNDYNVMYTNNRRVTPVDINSLHFQHRKGLKQQLDFLEFQKIPTIVLTHHMPSYKLISPKYANSPLNSGFASNCENLMTENVKLWIYGHTHNVSNILLNKTMCVVNSRGYPNELIHGFTNQAFYEFPLEEPSEHGALEELAASAIDVGELKESHIRI